MDILTIMYEVSHYLIEIMAVSFALALLLRYVAYRAARTNAVYYRTLCRSIDKKIAKSSQSDYNDQWLRTLFENLRSDLPARSLRSKEEQVTGTFRKQSLDKFVEKNRDPVHFLIQQIDYLMSPLRPNFREVTARILGSDRKWTTILGFIPVETLQRFLSTMPGLFIVGGIFGTFIGITAALPMISTIDLSNLAEASPILNRFVANIAYSMQTSIAGIVFSVMLTLLNTIYPIGIIRNEVKGMLNRTLELVWNSFHESRLSPGDAAVVTAIDKFYKLFDEQFSKNKGESWSDNKKVS